jgi:hypothetical protein
MELGFKMFRRRVNLDLEAALAFDKSHGKQATVAAVRPAKRFGATF